MADQNSDKHQAADLVDKRNPRSGDPLMGVALRSVYQRTVEEAVPDDLLDLLSKLD